MSKQRRAHVIANPDPTKMSILAPTTTAVVIKGESRDGETWTCPTCGIVLVQDVAAGQVQSIVIRCAGCGTHSAIGLI
jgi:predicted RNA-binding Zn-ribbon protein involved in translation (DUF1610 family)